MGGDRAPGEARGRAAPARVREGPAPEARAPRGERREGEDRGPVPVQERAGAVLQAKVTSEVGTSLFVAPRVPRCLSCAERTLARRLAGYSTFRFPRCRCRVLCLPEWADRQRM